MQPPIQPPLPVTPQPILPGPAQQRSNKKGILMGLLGAGLFLLMFFAPFGYMIYLFATLPDTVEAEPLAKTYSNEWISFKYPESWQERDISQQTIILNGRAVDRRAIITDKPAEATAIIDYRMQGSKKTAEVPLVERQNAIDQGLATQRTLTDQAMATMTRTLAHGCVDDFEYINRPGRFSDNGAVGMAYTYTCESSKGPITAMQVTWFDQFGNKHSFTNSLAGRPQATYRLLFVEIGESISVKGAQTEDDAKSI